MSVGMKSIMFILLLIPAICFAVVPLKRDSLTILKDSITKLNQRPVMTKAQFVNLYKYERLEKYYKICKRKPTQWKYYKGWSTRVFEL